MSMRELIQSISEKHRDTGIQVNPPASPMQIGIFEYASGISLPADFKEFYSICNGFSCEEDQFNIIPLHELLCYDDRYGKDWFYFSEYHVFCNEWLVKITGVDCYEIQNALGEGVLTHSLFEFLCHFLKGDVFYPGGLEDWGAGQSNPD
jgi:hypothetical protein